MSLNRLPNFRGQVHPVVPGPVSDIGCVTDLARSRIVNTLTPAPFAFIASSLGQWANGTRSEYRFVLPPSGLASSCSRETMIGELITMLTPDRLCFSRPSAYRGFMTCPKCTVSRDFKIRYATGFEYIVLLFITHRKYTCRKCGHSFRAPDRRQHKRDKGEVRVASSFYVK